MGEEGIRGDSSPANRRLTVEEAADQLGITEAAVRGRIKRGTLRSYREAGRVYVLLEGDSSSTNRGEPTGEPIDKPTDQSGIDEEGNEQEPMVSTEPRQDPRDELVDELRDRVRALEEANRENRRIIAALTSRIPQLEAPRDEPRGPETAAEGTGRVETPADTGGAQEATERRSWWRRFFGFE